mgnify:CR=1 FL=1
MKKRAIIAVFLFVLCFLTGCAKDSKDGTITITNVSYDPTREFYEQYNNIFETPETIEAVQETAGEVLTCDGDMVQAYFFSTSCGTTCRNDDVWGGDKLSYLNDQLETYAETEAKLNSTPVMLDHGYFQIGDGRLSTEEVFRDFIDKKIYVNLSLIHI